MEAEIPDKRAVGVFCRCGLFLVLSEIEPVEPDELPAVKRKLSSEGWQRILHQILVAFILHSSMLSPRSHR
jgi:hypothetical protein